MLPNKDFLLKFIEAALSIFEKLLKVQFAEYSPQLLDLIQVLFLDLKVKAHVVLQD